MDTELMEARLTRAASCLESNPVGAGVEELMQDLRSCESELVSRRFARAKAADGRPIRVRVPAADAALIHVSRALSLVGDDSQVDQARESIEHAREEVAHMSL